MNPSQILEQLMLKITKLALNDVGVDELNILQEAIIRLEKKDSKWMNSKFE